MTTPDLRRAARWLFAAALALTCVVYWPGLSGGWFFDDFPNIVDNADVQPQRLGVSELVAAALSSPASDLKRPLASLSFVANHAMGGLDPFGWKLTNLALHLLNGALAWLLARALFAASALRARPVAHARLAASLVAGGWLLLPINLSAVLLVVQRMEILANLFVLAGLLGYVGARRRMLERGDGAGLCIASLIVPTLLGALAKETAVMLPLYALLVEATLFGFRRSSGGLDRRILGLFGGVLVLPAIAGLAFLAPWVLDPATWVARDFTLATRLLSEARIVVAYIGWTLLPLPQSLSFYHDHFAVSQGVLAPWTTLASLLAIAGLLLLAWRMRDRLPLLALGIGLYFACHLLTATVIPLELIYEHRNYFASYGLLLAVVPLLLAPTPWPARVRHALLAILMLWWCAMTWLTAQAWGDPLRLAADLAARAPDSPRAQYGFGRALLDRSGPTPASPLFAQAYEVLERAGAMPESSILPEQAMILTSSLVGRPAEDRWWDRLIDKLARRAPNNEDISALGALTRCERNGDCNLPHERMHAAFEAAEAHPGKRAKLLAIRSDWAWSVLGDRVLGERYAQAAVEAAPSDADARVTLARMNIVLGNIAKAREQLLAIEGLNTGGRHDRLIAGLRPLVERSMPAAQ
ncbi:MAG: hypothetical protein EOP90_06200 [Lysobacteraceae bacterium]|nr:MAG: hypothetical protein EOP90_06200 [Xanthomonadaceae bacterium]